MTHMMVGYVEREVASSVALLDHLPPDERAAWLPRLARRSYTFILGPGETGAPLDAALSERFARSIGAGIGKRYPLTVNAVPGDRERFQVHLRLSDGSPLTIDMRPMVGTPLSGWLPLVLVLQLIVLGGCCWLAVRLATGPLKRLANAADTLGPDLKAERLPESGPEEVARAAKAFNAMQDRVSTYMTQRMQILAAITHDLQTPITRMRLRVDLMDNGPTSERLREDLLHLEELVRDGINYARAMHGEREPLRTVDLDNLLDSIALDYTDAGARVSLSGHAATPLQARPKALRRLFGNLIDNALKFGGSAAIVARIETGATGEAVVVRVLDEGPGIPPDMLEAVFEPFFRLEASRNRDTGGTGLGLAIARQFAQSMSGTLVLLNRPGGGLEARLTLPLGTSGA
jgi:signal transduction histidine kinase